MTRDALVSWMNATLRVDAIADASLNGLQVEGREAVARVALAVDACQAIFDAAIAGNFDMLLVHHGLFWGASERVVGRHARRLRTLLAAELNLYAAHLPLDLHPDLGNNAELARLLAMRDRAPFGAYHGLDIGFCGEISPISVNALAARLEGALGGTARVLPFGAPIASRVGIVSGGGDYAMEEAMARGLDTLITGEGPHHRVSVAEEVGLNVIYAGHYATETVGVRALGAAIAREFGLEVEFIDHPTGF